MQLVDVVVVLCIVLFSSSGYLKIVPPVRTFQIEVSA